MYISYYIRASSATKDLEDSKYFAKGVRWVWGIDSHSIRIFQASPWLPQIGVPLGWNAGMMRFGIIVLQIHFKWDVGMVGPGALGMSEMWLAVVIISSLDWLQIGFNNKMGFYCANLALESPAIDGLEINRWFRFIWDNSGFVTQPFAQGDLVWAYKSDSFEAFSSSVTVAADWIAPWLKR